MLTGTYEVRVDEAGRITVPKAHRDDLSEELMIRCEPFGQPNLQLIPKARFEEEVDQVFDQFGEAGRGLVLRLTMNAFPVGLDKAGRVLVPPMLRDRGGLPLNGNAYVVGTGERLDIWNEANFATLCAAVDSPDARVEDQGQYSQLRVPRPKVATGGAG